METHWNEMSYNSYEENTLTSAIEKNIEKDNEEIFMYDVYSELWQ